ncbi:DUF3489 domain-containing protein [Sphingomonas nostoxanthinifaciens]|uniref:DUF3489 domain-containing protein n=1 Tax=Sphingomonas nostoxanthinifaciens TaxID=2872652 RepID=UPI001CC20693|nr:DUF3489 domain-containing protein [Sphingomonas nostoxanthinifaciens]UAK25639.1 DUF3489 domain-containing protein [Sphingomonas nostoxanthinifaciens]
MLDLLRRDAGATLTELITATAWLPHSTRAALTGLRKKGHAIERCCQSNANSSPLDGVRSMRAASLAREDLPLGQGG